MSAIRCVIMVTESGRKEKIMAKTKGVSSKTHTKSQCDDYANQHNPNNKAYKANAANKKAVRSDKKHFYLDDYAPAEWYCYSNPYDFD